MSARRASASRSGGGLFPAHSSGGASRRRYDARLLACGLVAWPLASF
jgi:hypothetical protein